MKPKQKKQPNQKKTAPVVMRHLKSKTEDTRAEARYKCFSDAIDALNNREARPAIVSDPPVNVAIPNTTEVKMQAILALSKAVQALAETLDSVNTNISIIGNTITASAKGGSGIGVSMKPNP